VRASKSFSRQISTESYHAILKFQKFSSADFQRITGNYYYADHIILRVGACVLVVDKSSSNEIENQAMGNFGQCDARPLGLPAFTGVNLR
jgi:hypothetical protein